ncbi:aspartic peptidase domain-containing protein [Globomyces pollinis-pini]|nr:aspartic peptidase domain-containing protein [Globomyces pollinis-pini]
MYFSFFLFVPICISEPVTVSLSKQSIPNYISRISTTSLTNVSNAIWLCPLSVGTVDETFWLQVDTGSADTWIRGKSCVNPTNDGSCEGPKLEPTIESGIQSLKSSFSNSYGTGKLSADIYISKLAIGDLSTSIPFGVSTMEEGFSRMDGLLGLGFSQVSSIAKATGLTANFFDSLGYTDDENKFGFYLSNFSSGGELTFGGVDRTRYSGRFQYFSQVKLQKLDRNTNSPIIGIVDTGSSLILLSQGVADAVNKAIGALWDPQKNFYIIDCKKKNLPNVVFRYNEVEFIIPPSVYVYPIGIICISGITNGISSSKPGLIFGAVFLRQYYSVFDKSTTPPRVGFALANHQKSGELGNIDSYLKAEQKNGSSENILSFWTICIAATISIFVYSFT